MARERRKLARRVINSVAEYRHEGAPPRTCMVTDVSDAGARLYSETAMPDSFTLWLTGEGVATRCDCRVMWRLGNECGVSFVDVPALRARAARQ